MMKEICERFSGELFTTCTLWILCPDRIFRVNAENNVRLIADARTSEKLLGETLAEEIHSIHVAKTN